MARSTPFTVALLVFTSWGLDSRLAAGELIVVHLKDGSRRAGEINTLTDDAQLWLHTAGPSVVVLSSLAWERIESADVAGNKLTAAELREIADRQKSPVPPIVVERPSMKTVRILPRMQSLEILPWLANWDRDAAIDGVQVRLSPLDSEGEIAPVNGLATVRIYARRNAQHARLEYPAQFGFWTDGGSVREYAIGQRYVRYLELGRWTRRVRIEDFDQRGVVLNLPYQAVNPDRDLGVDLNGIVEVTLRVNGQNIYRAASPLQLRSFDPFREELQLHRGQRFLPDE